MQSPHQDSDREIITMSAGPAPERRRAAGVRVFAPAKINLFLHVGEKRPDSYHALQSLIAFAEVGDRIQITAAPEYSLSATGPFAAALPPGDDNLVLRAARALSRRAGVREGAAIRLEKNLPVAAGIGGGSADAAAVLRGLQMFWQLEEFDLFSLAAELGSDVPVCLLSRPCWVEGRGEILTPQPPLPRLATVLVNPGIALSTAAVFAALNARSGTGALQPPRALENLWDVIGYLGDAGNDLEAPACQIAPVIQEVLNAFDREPGCALAAMSGSGSTCFAFFHEHDFARGAAERIAVDHPQWWVSLSQLAGPECGRADLMS
jgi:4-diphosphocytidyl-2-C-methyl-D-erythritol kinase